MGFYSVFGIIWGSCGGAQIERRPRGAGFQPCKPCDIPLALQHHSQPDRIPMWIITSSSYQTSSYRIGNDVSGDPDYFFIMAQSVIVITSLPDGCNLCSGFAQSMAGSGLESLHQCPERHFFQLQQPMYMVRHYYPGQRSAVVLLICSAKVMDHQACKPEVPEQGATQVGN